MVVNYERRFIPAQIEVRSEGNSSILTGYAAVFNKRSQDLGGFVEQLAPGTFTKTLKDGADVRALMNHDPNLILGRSTSGTLRMSQDTTGLHYEVGLGEQSYARDLAISLERGDITQSSFGFRTIRDDWTLEDDTPLRTLLEVALTDVSPVTYPAYTDATSGLGGRALERLAEARGWAPGTVTAVNLAEALRGAPVEAEPDELGDHLEAIRTELERVGSGDGSLAQVRALLDAAVAEIEASEDATKNVGTETEPPAGTRSNPPRLPRDPQLALLMLTSR